MNGPKYPGEIIVERGEIIYQEKLQHLNRPENVGKYLMIDIESGNYEMGDNDLEVSRRAHEKYPDGEFYGMLIGYRGTGAFGMTMEDIRL